jgi:hypothetical protein
VSSRDPVITGPLSQNRTCGPHIRLFRLVSPYQAGTPGLRPSSWGAVPAMMSTNSPSARETTRFGRLWSSPEDCSSSRFCNCGRRFRLLLWTMRRAHVGGATDSGGVCSAGR